MDIEFCILGKPQGKARPRLTRDGHAYTPKATRDYEREIRECFRKATGHRYEPGVAFPKDVPVRMTVRVYNPIPASAGRKRQEAMRSGVEPCIRKPDLDNVLKAVADALIGWAYEDDSQVTSIRTTRDWGLVPRVEVLLSDDCV